MARRAVATVSAIILAVGACGGDDASVTPTTAPPASPADGPATDGADTTDDPATVPSPTAAPTTATGGSTTDGVQQFPDVVGVDASFDDASSTWTFAVTVSSPYDTPARYADGWRVVGPDGTVYGVHTLAHDHAGEQPFTRRQTGVAIPDGVTEVTIEGRDQEYGFGGGTMTISLQTG